MTDNYKNMGGDGIISPEQSAQDQNMMTVAIALAERHIGRTWPNPSVGCVIVQNGPDHATRSKIIGRGVTALGGRPHGETIALTEAGALAKGATAYVTLEPCCHHGVTPPCTDALIEAGIKRVVIGMIDPDPRMDGGGVMRLRQAGIAVTQLKLTNDLAVRCHALVAGFVTRMQKKRPLVSVKIASSLDARIATSTGESRWITGQAARQRGHLLRARHDAIMIGSGTALTDDPMLDCRLPGMADWSPLRIILDGRLRLPLDTKLVKTGSTLPTWLFTDETHLNAAKSPQAAAKIDQLTNAGVKIFGVARCAQGHLDLTAILSALAAQGLTSILVEGGGGVIASVIKQNYLDRLYWFRAPIIIGGDGVAAIPNALYDAQPALAALANLPRRALIGSEEFLGDTKINGTNSVEKLEIYQCLR
ncbi:MAG: bifunctional diaminohydroxyphosphoribosylaminopyrimidine deaminase/5-amino-6-(5-phosphoribosylamino)uracil reductase RibD [Alphaproteobacteria bacterium]|nr:bifunctional diaminohydroxyphosphoribosylaminopyrimidine deaminase/5-amino-6-(5-phosphoribosylamino)uracil reductase RibD [Alphaproteobacteria bacterium]